MQITCNECEKPATVALITEAVLRDYTVTGACDDHAPEVMHEMVCSGYTTDEMVRVTIDQPTRTEVLAVDVTGTPVRMGNRVQIPAVTDDWMRGDRYGFVIGHHNGVLTVKLDKSGKVRTFLARDCRV